jgi:hypothetical protein
VRRFPRRTPRSGGILRRSLLALLLTATASVATVAPAQALIPPATTIDGPSEGIVGFGGVAMAEDGAGGLVYLKLVEGVAHVFVSRFVDGQWQAPIRVDYGERFAASWPRIGAAEGGELVVVWATPYGTEGGRPVDELLGSTLGPGASSFGPAKVIDRDIRFGTGTSPDLAMSSSGQADVVYRVVEEGGGQETSIPLLRAGDVVEEVRVAHFEGETWSRLGAINRDAGVSMRSPTEANAPQIAIGPTGDAVVVWQEPDTTGVARIWARRIFGRSLDYVMPVSATTYHGVTIGDDADAPSVALTPTGQALVAYRQGTSPGSPLPGLRIFANTLPDGISAEGAQFLGAAVADEAVSGGTGASVGPPAVDIDAKDDTWVLYDANGTPRLIETPTERASETLSFGSPFAGTDLAAASVMNPGGGGILAWPSEDARGAGVAMREELPDGAVQTALLRGGDGGPISGLAVGASGLGDGLFGFMEGPLGNAAIVGVHVSAPPAQFLVSVPRQWVKPADAVVSWSPAPTTNGPVTYAVVRDGVVLPVPPGALELRLDPRGLGSGAHSIQVLATDADGATILSPVRTLRVDGQPPTVTLRRRGARTLTVSIVDRFSGVDKRAVRVSFGDGRSASGRTVFSHTYARAGLYTVIVQIADRVGNRGVARRLVSIG